MADNNRNLIVMQQLLHVQQLQAEDEQQWSPTSGGVGVGVVLLAFPTPLVARFGGITNDSSNNRNNSINVLSSSKNCNEFDRKPPPLSSRRADVMEPPCCRSATPVAPPAPQWHLTCPAVLPPMIAVAPPSNCSGNSMGSPCPP